MVWWPDLAFALHFGGRGSHVSRMKSTGTQGSVAADLPGAPAKRGTAKGMKRLDDSIPLALLLLL